MATTDPTPLPVTLTINGGGGAYSGVLSGTGGLVMNSLNGSGVLTLGNVNTYLGNTTVNGGTLALGITNALPNTTILTVSGTSAKS